MPHFLHDEACRGFPHLAPRHNQCQLRGIVSFSSLGRLVLALLTTGAKSPDISDRGLPLGRGPGWVHGGGPEACC